MGFCLQLGGRIEERQRQDPVTDEVEKSKAVSRSRFVWEEKIAQEREIRLAR